MKRCSVVSVALFLTVLVAACGEDKKDAASAELTFDQFFSALPEAVCEHYLRCNIIAPEEQMSCPNELYDDLERNYVCNAARGLFPQLEAGLRNCLDGEPKPCGSTDDLDLFCPSLELLENECEQAQP